jgi:hypothetical protein
MDNRPTNNDRPRISSSDPTQSIDKPEQLSILSFPIDRPKYYVSFRFEEYRRPNQFQGLQSNGDTAHVCLPIPQNLQDNNHFTWNEQQGSIIIEALTQSSREIGNALKQSFKQGSIDPLKDSAGTILNHSGDAAMGIGIHEVVDLANVGESILSSNKGNQQTLVSAGLQIGGLADNPFNTIAFEGPNFKQHQFSWMLAPKSKSESDALKKIVYTFKKAAHPELLSMAAGGFFKYPNIVWIKFNPDSLSQNLYTFKPCVMVDVNIDYTPHGMVGFFGKTEAPIRATLNINFLEIEIWRGGDGDTLADGSVPTISNGDFNSAPKDLGSLDNSIDLKPNPPALPTVNTQNIPPINPTSVLG